MCMHIFIDGSAKHFSAERYTAFCIIEMKSIERAAARDQKAVAI